MHPRLEPVRRAIGAYSPTRLALKGAGDRAADEVAGALGRTARIDALARAAPTYDVLAVGVYLRTPKRFPDTVAELGRSRHRVRVRLGSMGDEAAPELAATTAVTGLAGGKFANANTLIAGDDGPPPRWTLVMDHDARLPTGWLDRFLALAEAFDLALCQPALSLRSFYSHPLTRRRPWAVARETRFVEIGPVTAFSRRAAAELLPFPELRYGWGLDLHWAAIADQRGWRLGVVDALPVRHESGLVAAAYPREEAEAEAARFLADRPYLPSARAGEVLAVHRRAPA